MDRDTTIRNLQEALYSSDSRPYMTHKQCYDVAEVCYACLSVDKDEVIKKLLLGHTDSQSVKVASAMADALSKEIIKVKASSNE
jgi:hypothetical protein